MQLVNIPYYRGSNTIYFEEMDYFKREILHSSGDSNHFRRVTASQASWAHDAAIPLKKRALNWISLPIRELGNPWSYSQKKGWAQKFYKSIAFFTKAMQETFPNYSSYCRQVDYAISIPRGWATYMKSCKNWSKSRAGLEEDLRNIQFFRNNHQASLNPTIREFIENRTSTRLGDITGFSIGMGKVLKVPFKLLSYSTYFKNAYPQSHVLIEAFEKRIGYAIHYALLTIVARNCAKSFYMVKECIQTQEIASKKDIQPLKLKRQDPILYAIWKLARENRKLNFQMVFLSIEFSKLFCLSVGLLGYFALNYWITFITACIELGFSYYRYQYLQSQREERQKLSQSLVPERMNETKKQMNRYLEIDDGTLAAGLLYNRIKGNLSTHQSIAQVLKFDSSTLKQIQDNIIPESMAKSMIKNRLFIFESDNPEGRILTEE